MLENNTNQQTTISDKSELNASTVVNNKPISHRKIYNIMSWVFIDVTIFIFCMLIIIASIGINLVVTNRFNRIADDPQVYKLLVTQVTFIIMDICFMFIWFGLIIAGLVMGNKYKQLTTNKRLFNIANAVLLGIFLVLSIIVAVLGILWLGGYYNDIQQRVRLVVAIAVLELIKAAFLIGAFVISIRILKRNRKLENKTQNVSPLGGLNEIK